MAATFPDIREKLNKFLATKMENPLTTRYGKHDSPMRGHLAGFWHCHLRDDAVLIYDLSDRVLTLVYLTPHAEIEGKRLKSTAMRLAQFVS